MRTAPVPPPSFVKDLTAYDASLRVRWGAHTERWFIERKMPERNPAWTSERPLNPFGTNARARDLWAGWKEGYVLVMMVHPDVLHWRMVAPALADTDLHQAGSFEALNRKLDAADAAVEAERERTLQNWSASHALDAADALQWGFGHRVATAHEESGVVPSDRVEQHPDGFTIRTRKGAHA